MKKTISIILLCVLGLGILFYASGFGSVENLPPHIPPNVDITPPDTSDKPNPEPPDLPNPPVDPPVDPPIDPPVDPPIDPPVDPPIDPPVDPPIDPPVDPPDESIELKLNREYDADIYWERAQRANFVKTECSLSANPYDTDCRVFWAPDGLYFSYISFDDNIFADNQYLLNDHANLNFKLGGKSYQLKIDAFGEISSNYHDEFLIVYDIAGSLNDKNLDYCWGFKFFLMAEPEEFEINISMSNNSSKFNNYLNSFSMTIAV